MASSSSNSSSSQQQQSFSDSMRGPGGALAAQAMVRDRGTIDKLTKELDRTRTRLVEVEDELRRKEDELGNRYETELESRDEQIGKLKRENRRLITAKGFGGSSAAAGAGGGDSAAIIEAQTQEIADLKSKVMDMDRTNGRRREEMESGFQSEIRQSFEEIMQLRAQIEDSGADSGGGVDNRDAVMREKDEEVARYVLWYSALMFFYVCTCCCVLDFNMWLRSHLSFRTFCLLLRSYQTEYSPNSR